MRVCGHSPPGRAPLAAFVGDRSRPLKHVQRARLVLHSADRLPAVEISRKAVISRPAVWRWQRHYAEESVQRRSRASRKPRQGTGRYGNDRQGKPTAVETDMHRLAGNRWQTWQDLCMFRHGRRELRCFWLIRLRATESYPNRTAHAAPACPLRDLVNDPG